MKRLKSSDDISSYGDKGPNKDWARRDEDVSLHRSLSSHRNMYHKSDNGKKGLSSSSSRYDRLDDDRESSRSVRKRPDYDADSYDRRKSYDRYRDGGERGIMSSSPRGIMSSSPRGGFGGDRIHRSESFSVPRREFPKGFRSDRDRSRREGSVSSWRRFSGAKDVDESGSRSGVLNARGSRVASDDTGKVKSPGGSLGEIGRPNSWQSGWTADRPQGLRSARSPSFSKSARSPSFSKSARSPSFSKSTKSPSRSKDSGSEQSKSVEVKKSDELPIESGYNSEMEEGELEPDPEPVPEVKNLTDNEADDGSKVDKKELSNNDILVEAKSSEHKNVLSEAKLQLDQMMVDKEQTEIQVSEATNNVLEHVNNLSGSPKTSAHNKSDDEDANATTVLVEVTQDEQCTKETSISMERISDPPTEQCPSNDERKDNKGIDMEVKSENIDLPGLVEGIEDKNVTSRVVLSFMDDRVEQSFKDKGKSLALSPPTEDVSIAEAETYKEGPSPRGFQLFFVDPVKKSNIADKSSNSKLKDEQIATEPLELSLSLPNVLFPNKPQNTIQATNSQNTVQAPGSPSHGRSVQSFTSSFRTSSDAFTASMSFSGSQTFTHNPSCSLTNNSYDNCEKSVGSRPIFQGVDLVTPAAWQGQSSNETENKENAVYQRLLSNGNGRSHHSQVSQDILNGHVVRLHHRVEEGSSKLPRLDRQLSYNKQLASVQLRPATDIRSPTQSTVSHGIGSDYWNGKSQIMRDKMAGDIQDEKHSLPGAGGEADFMEPIINMIISDPIHTVARIFHEMTQQAASRLKESVRDLVLNPGKRSKLRGFQKALQRRSDITLEILLKSHRAHLEVLVALKTGLQDFLQLNSEISSSDLAEIFLSLRCCNLTCRSQLPVDECDCKICVQKNGFCSACMCLVCSKFDTASNTCSWVGCDVCLHWCHADCGLRESYIRNGYSATRAQGITDMQFHCLACDHPSEMFGFVKEVFLNFAKDWTAETLSKELEYVRKIFYASEDARGKRLREMATQMLTRLANKSDIQEVRSSIMALLTETSPNKSSSQTDLGKESLKKKQGEAISIIPGSSREPAWLNGVYSDKPLTLEKSASLLPSFDFDMNDKHISSSDLLKYTQKEPAFDELESIVRIKQAEAKMFQSRADDARREAEGLARIAKAKNEKIEEEYTSRIRKLQLAEAEEIRRQKCVELQALEREHQEYFNMKTRMKTEIKDLLLKMEATKCNFTL